MLVPDRRNAGAILLSDGDVLLIGGSSGIDTTEHSTERYHPTRNSWERGVPAKALHGDATVLLATGKALAVAGSSPLEPRTSAGAELYDPAANTWSWAAAMHEPERAGATVTLLSDGRLLVVGGGLNSGASMWTPSRAAELYDPVTNRWTITTGPATVRIHHTATLLPDGSVLVVGGSPECLSCTVKDSAAVYRP